MNLSPRQNEVGTLRTWLPIVAIATVLIGGIACSDATGPERPVQIVPASPSVALQTTSHGPLLNTSVTVTNRSSSPVVYSSCGLSLEKKALPALPPGKSDWQFVWSQICAVMDLESSVSTMPIPGTGLGQTILQPGASVTIQIWAMVGEPAFPSFTGEPGLYRVHVPLSALLFGKFFPASAEQSVSEPFAVTPAP